MYFYKEQIGGCAGLCPIVEPLSLYLPFMWEKQLRNAYGPQYDHHSCWVNALQVTSSGKVRRTSDYKFFTEFQSHEAEFDYLKSLEIEEKINAIKWCPRANGALFLLSTNGEAHSCKYTCACP